MSRRPPFDGQFGSQRDNLRNHLDYLEWYGENWTREDVLEWVAAHRRLLDHGTRGFYQKGCRCDWCSAANTQYYQTRGYPNGQERRGGFVRSLQEDAL